MSHFHGLSILKNYITPINLEIIARREKKLSGIRVKKFKPLKVHKLNNFWAKSNLILQNSSNKFDQTPRGI